MPVKRPIFRYCMLAFLFAITVAYEVPYLHDILRDQTRRVPFFTMETATDRIDIVTRDAAQAGIRKGDEVLSIDGRPYKGLSDWAHPLARTTIGQSITLVLRSDHPSNPNPRVVVLPVTAVGIDPWRVAGELALYFLLPAICVLLGFWVALQRLRDPMAWLLLALMLTFPHIFESDKAEAWPPGWRGAGDILVAYTDGVTEAMNAANEEWGEDRMMQTIESCGGLPAREIMQRIFAAADAFAAGAKQHDDMTLVVLRAVADGSDVGESK